LRDVSLESELGQKINHKIWHSRKQVNPYTIRRRHMPKFPGQYTSIQKRYKGLIKAVENVGKAAKTAGPLNKKISELVQLAAAASIRSEGSVHSHARRALAAGAKPEEVRHTVVLLTSTIGFPTVSAALSWIDDVLEKKRLL
jgi:4-carboxymuconolactone decarboxylase